MSVIDVSSINYVFAQVSALDEMNWYFPPQMLILRQLCCTVGIHLLRSIGPHGGQDQEIVCFCNVLRSHVNSRCFFSR